MLGSFYFLKHVINPQLNYRWSSMYVKALSGWDETITAIHRAVKCLWIDLKINFFLAKGCTRKDTHTPYILSLTQTHTHTHTPSGPQQWWNPVSTDRQLPVSKGDLSGSVCVCVCVRACACARVCVCLEYMPCVTVTRHASILPKPPIDCRTDLDFSF